MSIFCPNATLNQICDMLKVSEKKITETNSIGTHGSVALVTNLKKYMNGEEI